MTEDLPPVHCVLSLGTPPIRGVSEERGEGRGGGKGFRKQKMCAPKMAQINFSFSKFPFFPTQESASASAAGGGGGV